MKWLVAVDCSKNAEHAFNAACSMMGPDDVMYVISVAEFMVFYSGYAAQPVTDLNRKAEKIARRVLIKFCHECTRRNIKHYSVLGMGDPREVICQAVEEKKIDMLVLGRRGMSGLERIFVGSVSEHCVQNAKCSVFVVKCDESKLHEEFHLDAGGPVATTSTTTSGAKEDKRLSALELLDRTPVSSLLRKRSVIYLETTNNVSDVLRKITENNIHSIPIFDKAKNSFIGALDMIDVMCYALTVLSENDMKDAPGKVLAHKDFLSKPCGELCVESPHLSRNPFFPIAASSPLRSAIEVMNAKHLHRLAVMQDATLIGVLTQSLILGFGLRNLRSFKLSEKTIGEINLGTKAVVTINQAQQVKDAFQVMKDRCIGGLAVVDDNGALVGNISATDLRVVYLSGKEADLFGYLHLSIKSFLELTTAKQDRPEILTGPICVRPSATIEELLIKFCDAHVHRVFVVDESSKPVTVITSGDVINMFAQSALSP